MTTPIASYRERRFDGQRVFELHPDCVIITGSAALGAKFEQRVSLDGLGSNPDKVWSRPNGFWGGVWMAVVCSLVALGFEPVLTTWWKGLIWGTAFSGALLSIVTARRVEWVVFRNDAGAEILSIAKAGKSSGEFSGFVAHVGAAIANRRAALPPNTSLERTREG